MARMAIILLSLTDNILLEFCDTVRDKYLISKLSQVNLSV